MSEASLLYLIFSINILGLADRDRETKRGDVKAVDSAAVDLASSMMLLSRVLLAVWPQLH